MVDVGDRLSRERLRKAISEAEIALGWAMFEGDDNCEDLVDAVIEHFGPASELVKIRQQLALTIEVKGK